MAVACTMKARVAMHYGPVVLPAVLFGMFLGFMMGSGTCDVTEPVPWNMRLQMEAPVHVPKEEPPAAAPRTESSLLDKTHFNYMYAFPRSQFTDFVSEIPHQNGPREGLLLTRLLADNPFDLRSASSKCHEIDVVVTSKLACLAVFQNDNFNAPYSVMRYLPSETSQKGKGRYSLASHVKSWARGIPNKSNFESQEKLLLQFLQNKETLEKEIETLVKTIAVDRNVIVMCLNQGNLDLLINFVSSAQHANIPIPNLLVFASDADVVKKLEPFKLHVVDCSDIGTFPTKAANGYGDGTFTRMMWLKVLSVYMVNRLEYNVLFQDADLVWFKDPFTYFEGEDMQGADVVFMDDGARSERFNPLFGNTGFYYVRYTPTTRVMMQELLFSNHLIEKHKSHQAVVIQRMNDMISKYGLRYKLLPMDLFPTGMVYHHRKSLMSKITSGQHQPFVFHMCWTKNRVEKLIYFKKSNMWYLPKTCTLDTIMQGDTGTCLDRTMPLIKFQQ